MANLLNRTQEGRYTAEQHQAFISQVLQDGYCILPHHFSVDVLAEWKRQFLPLLNERIQDGTASARGPNRYYISLPFIPPFADPAIYEDPDILAIIEQLAQEDIVMPELATDTPLQGSDYQVIHRDMLQCSPDMPDADPVRPFQFAVNFPLVDVTLENGPFEIAPGTHLLTDTECQDRVRSGQAEAQLVPLVMSVGDVMIRDVRALHRGTPNTTAEPRPMVVVGYNCARHQRPQLRIFIPQEQKRLLSDRAQQLLRFNPVVNSLSEVVASETYSNLYFLDKT